jgi:capsular polysaccharide biosynthesis protein
MAAMTLGTTTTRDQMAKLLAITRRALRYWWIVALCVIGGGALSVTYAIARPLQFESQTVLMYREMIPTAMLQGRDVAHSTRNLSGQYQEIVLARSNLRKVVLELGLHDDREDIDLAVEALRQQLTFRTRGTNTFEISFRHESPEVAQQVAARMVELLREEDRRIRREQASITKTFLEEEKQRAMNELRARQRAMAEFLSEHPEFAEETLGGQSSAGASIRAQAKRGSDELVPAAAAEDPKLHALYRQRARIRQRLVSPGAPIPGISKSPERVAAEARVREAQRIADDAARQLQELQARGFTERHPDLISARARVRDAQRQLAHEQGALPQHDDPLAAAGPIDPRELEAQLRDVDQEITRRRAELRGVPSDTAAPDSEPAEGESWVVALETQWAGLLRDLDEARSRVGALESRVFTAEITASSEMAEQGGQLSVIDPAHRPQMPVGRGKRIIVMAGVVLFGGFGAGRALGVGLP